ncbi:hypothetical protein ACX928_04945 [Enterobacter roggenkampii]|uniref:hypothetical protein n=1 Tax=Atlantibacter hermannii TaxID=565 RepID=UPI0028B09D86|nr:hypothetical protein [Atlantibacter hermannii]EDV0343390.1 hypothetical protein [Salmonella enterica subsp. enterica serovar Minnesota]
MGAPDANYQVVYRGEVLLNYVPGGWVFFQRSREFGGGYWLGKTFDDVFAFEFCHPVSLSQGVRFLLNAGKTGKRYGDCDDNFQLSPPPSDHA